MTFTTKIILISPELAANWLRKSPPNYRKFIPALCTKYAHSMKIGKWKLTHQGIAFDQYGYLIDGYHRLAAIVDSGVSIQIEVTYGVAREDEIAIDSGKTRTFGDRAKFMDKPYGASELSIARLMNSKGQLTLTRFIDGYKIDIDNQFVVVEKYLAGIRFVMQGKRTFPKNISAPVMAVVARAFYTADKNRLQEFMNILETGVIKTNKDITALKLRDYLYGLHSRGGSQIRFEIYQKTEFALDAFLKNRPLKLIGFAREELFVITPSSLKLVEST